jgi:hypothetical protein
MKSVIYALLALQRVALPFRFTALLGGFTLLGWWLIPDLSYDIAGKKVPVMTMEQFMALKPEAVPRFVTLTGLRPFNRDYVETVRGNVHTLHAITYPVYSATQLSQLKDSSGKGLVSHLVVIDHHVSKTALDTGSYFQPETYVLSGKCNGLFRDSSIIQLLASSGYTLASDCWVIERGETPLSLQTCALYISIDLMCSVVIFGSFLRRKKLMELLIKII